MPGKPTKEITGSMEITVQYGCGGHLIQNLSIHILLFLLANIQQTNLCYRFVQMKLICPNEANCPNEVLSKMSIMTRFRILIFAKLLLTYILHLIIQDMNISLFVELSESCSFIRHLYCLEVTDNPSLTAWSFFIFK